MDLHQRPGLGGLWINGDPMALAHDNTFFYIKFLPLTLTFELGLYILTHKYQDSKTDTPTISKLLHVTDTGCK